MKFLHMLQKMVFQIFHIDVNTRNKWNNLNICYSCHWYNVNIKWIYNIVINKSAIPCALYKKKGSTRSIEESIKSKKKYPNIE